MKNVPPPRRHLLFEQVTFRYFLDTYCQSQDFIKKVRQHQHKQLINLYIFGTVDSTTAS